MNDIYKITPTIRSQKIDLQVPPTQLFDELGEDGIRSLMYEFYDEIYESPIAHFFPQDEDDFEKVKQKNADFFVQICAEGKIHDSDIDHYIVQLHNEFSIADKHRIEWLVCMQSALERCDLSNSAKSCFFNYLESLSKLTVNSFTDNNNYYDAYTKKD